MNSTSAAAAADDDDDASQSDVISPHPEYLLLINLGPRQTTKLVLQLLLLILLINVKKTYQFKTPCKDDTITLNN